MLADYILFPKPFSKYLRILSEEVDSLGPPPCTQAPANYPGAMVPNALTVYVRRSPYSQLRISVLISLA